MKPIAQRIQEFRTAFFNALHTADLQQLDTVRVTFLSRQGPLAELMGLLHDASLEEKKTWAPQLNDLKKEVTQAFEDRKALLLQEQADRDAALKKSFDVTAYKPYRRGTLHPLTQVVRKIEDISIPLGFSIADGPEVETDYRNFTALNIPEWHPAREMHDTFWTTFPHHLLRTHTSTVQVHEMRKGVFPLAVIAPGRCYRHEATDASHDFMFMQVEGMVIDKGISMAHLLDTLGKFLGALFEKKVGIRVRTGNFPFVEPGIEVDMSCPFCSTGCSVCKKTGWIEMAGAGLIHPNVLRESNIDPKVYSGFAFGLGLTRVAMLMYGITDIRLLHSNKLDFLKQF